MEIYHREITGGSRIMVGVHMFETDLVRADSPQMVFNEKQKISLNSDVTREQQV